MKERADCLFVVPTIGFDLLYGLVIVRLARTPMRLVSSMTTPKMSIVHSDPVPLNSILIRPRLPDTTQRDGYRAAFEPLGT